ncbi:MAG: tetratricopeptide repeat protein [Vicinamibacteraceae bacterium]
MQWGKSQRSVLGLLVVLVAWAAPSFAQSTGMVKGKVVDAANQIVEGATVIIETSDSGARRFKVTTNKKGEYIQIGLQPGKWSVTAAKDGIGEAKADVRITLGASEQIDLTLTKGGAAAGTGPSKEEAAKQAAMQKAFDDGVALTQAGKLDEAIAKFSEAKAVNPDCFACQFNIGLSYAAKKDVPKAEEAFLAASALKPESPEPFNQMANMYNAAKQFDKAAQMAAEASKRSGGAAGGGASAESLFNQGVVLWNGQKYAEAKVQFEAAVKAKPEYAEAHYWLGMASLNTGAMPAARASFESYLKHAPTGQYAEQVKTFLAQLPK